MTGQSSPAHARPSVHADPSLLSPSLRVHPSFPHYFLTKRRKHTSARSFTGEVRQNTEHKLVIPHARRRPRTADISTSGNMSPKSRSSLGWARGGSRLPSCGSRGIRALPVMTRRRRWRSLLLQIPPRWLRRLPSPQRTPSGDPPGGRMCCFILRGAGDYVTTAPDSFELGRMDEKDENFGFLLL